MNGSAVQRSFFKSERERWQAEYVRRVTITDTVVVVGAVALAQLIRFGRINVDAGPVIAGSPDIGYTAVSVMLATVWLVLLAALDSRSPRHLGNGPEEYRRIATASMWLFGAVAIVSLVAQLDFARGYLAIALPVGALGLMVSRRAWRRHVAGRRQMGDYQSTVIVVGRANTAKSMVQTFRRHTDAGYRVVGVCTPSGSGAPGGVIDVDGIEVPIVGDASSIVEALRLTGADTVVVTAVEQLGEQGFRRLVWDLEPLGVDLVVTPGTVDAGGPRLVTRPVADLPLLHIEKPQYSNANALPKLVFDFAFAVAALVAVTPVMVVAALAVKFTSRGPVFYKSERMGIDGKPFRMIKFRSMYVDADKHIDALLQQNEGAGVLFKMREDPRVTPVGRILRKYSLDELPQFFNVVRGEMSVVGPRPPLRREVEAYDGMVRRRLLVKPGLTGLWQVSGRSDLSWEESVRLDLSYVENWSMMQDLLIIKRTVSAVARSEGAY